VAQTENGLRAAILLQRTQLMAWAVKLTRDVSDAEDLVQDTFVRVLVNLDKFRDAESVCNGHNGQLRAWLYRVMRNLFLTKVRKGGTYRIPPGEVNDDTGVILESVPTPAEQTCQIAVKEISGQIDALPPHYRQVVLLLALDGGKQESLAFENGINHGTFKSRTARARVLLATRLGLNIDQPIESDPVEAAAMQRAA
jgi:RNA polymerase sigma-70 factor (ECF subfamily)